MRPPHLAGKWALSGQQPGKGPVFGQVVITPAGNPDSGEFTTESTFTYARSGETVKRTGRAIVYTGYQWRGKSDTGSGPNNNTAWREVLFVDRDWRRASGRWFTGAYDEFGIDVDLERIGADPIVLGVADTMIKTGTAGQEVKIYGANLPARVQAADLNFGPGITVDRIVSATPEQLTVGVSVAATATTGRRDVILTGASGNASVAVYNTIDYIKVLPQAGLARVGGANFPKQYQQFEAVAYANGPDGKPNTKDDVELGHVEVTWSIEEYTATFDDDDKDFVGTIDPSTGLFTPNLDGPNPKRRHNTNNYGDVWVVATYQQPKPIKARAHLLVTVPLYIKWDQAEVSR
jgi:quinohemoprotein amine dehydrogenase